MHSFIAARAVSRGGKGQQLYLVMVSSFKLIHSLASLEYAKVRALQLQKQKPLGQPPRALAWATVREMGLKGAVACRLTMATGALHCVAVCAAQSSHGAAAGRGACGKDGRGRERRHEGCATPADCMQIG